MPGLFGPKGRVPLPEAWKTSESRSPAANKAIHFWENTALSSVGTIVGAFIDAKSAIKNAVSFIEPLDDSASQYNNLNYLNLQKEKIL